MSKNSLYPVSPEHMVGMGMIVQFFARHELLMTKLMSKIIGCKELDIVFLMSGLGYQGKRDAVLSVLVNSTMPKDQKDKINSYLDELNSYKNLRNNAAHSAWVDGKRNGSIKPMFFSARGGSAKLIGFKHNEKDYTPDELIAAGTKISELHDNFRNYLMGVGLL